MDGDINIRIVPTQQRTKPLRCKLRLHKWSRHYSASEFYKKFYVCTGCGKWKHNRAPGH